MKRSIAKAVSEVVRASEALKSEEASIFIEALSQKIAECFQRGGKILIAGNGGSLCDAMHFAEELTGQFRSQRRALAAIALSDPSHMSCVGNDYGFSSIFARHVEALGKRGDLFIALSTSGNSQNLIEALKEAKRKGLLCVGFLGKTGGEMKGMADLEWIVSGFPYSDRIQEAHMAAIHIVVEMVEEILFSPSSEKPKALFDHATR